MRWHPFLESQWTILNKTAKKKLLFKTNSFLKCRHKRKARPLCCLLWTQDKNVRLESHLEPEVAWVWLYSIPITSIFGLHHKEFQRDNFAQCGVSWQGVLLKHRVLTALKVIKVLWDCVCDSPAGRDVLHTRTGALEWGCGHRNESGGWQKPCECVCVVG